MTPSDIIHIVTDGNLAGDSPTLFPHMDLDDEAISAWLNNCPLYNAETKRWREIPDPSDLNMNSEPLRGAFNAIYATILERFNSQVSNTSRWLSETRGIFMDSQREASFVDRNGCTVAQKRAPDFCIFSAAPTCPGRADVQPPQGYLNCILPIEVIRETALNFDEEEKSLYTFAWQCFANQLNCRHLNSMLMTDMSVYLFVHDRYNTFRTKGYNIHSEAPTLVRMLLGLASDHAASIGFDPRIVYDEKGSSIMLLNSLSEGEPRIEHLLKLDVVGLLPNRSHSVRGRGTICWDDYWRPFLSQPEWVIMKRLKGLAGVAQIVGYDDNAHLTISSLRAGVIEDGSSISPQHNLNFTRILVEAYGKSLEHFNSPMHLLRAFRDAIAGHANMWREGILHRDVSINNVLHGIKDAIPGERGKMIDFDMATSITEDTKTTTVGTRPFQSAMLLVSANKRHSQDHLDDLESFLYILLYICCKKDGPGSPIPEYPDIFDEFGCDDAARA
ncbi:hypothetical protein D9619_010174 [Psilocybe cf. subviscida]|uniref:Protein kinase domain-containing protein n=1 Tax=Psilocybe cf. subviscida TaxID=2480587 RepID=A0A8H5AT55_9AGAR|nr:hypothetical protein D9619_010174 [Psilocybe cf. subviscida]